MDDFAAIVSATRMPVVLMGKVTQAGVGENRSSCSLLRRRSTHVPAMTVNRQCIAMLLESN